MNSPETISVPSHRAVVIGSGFGGLAAAVRLRAMGYTVTVLEALAQPGGRARQFIHDNYLFDSGPTIVTAPHLFDELFELLGKCREDYFGYHKLDPFYEVRFTDGHKFRFFQEEDALLEEIRQISPSDVDGYIKIARFSEECCKIGFEQLGDQPFSNFSDLLRLIPTMIRLRAFISVYDLVSYFIKDERVRQILCVGPLFVGGNPRKISALYLLIHWIERKWGVHYPKGGVYTVVQGLVQLLEDSGVEVRCNSAVEEIIVNHTGTATGVRFADGEIISSDIVVSNGDPSFVYKYLIDPKKRRKLSDANLERKSQSPSVYIAYFSRSNYYKDLEQHTILIGSDFNEELNNIFRHKKITPIPSLYLHLPSRTDSALFPSGQDVGYVLSVVPNQQSGLDWKEEGVRQMERISDTFTAHGMGRFLDGLRIHQTIDPREFSGPLRSIQGAAFGLEALLLQTAYFRYQCVSKEVKGLYFVGASTHPGAGIPGVISSAKILERVLLKLAGRTNAKYKRGANV